MLIGLTGGIACGKSTVSKFLAQKGAIIVPLKITTPPLNSIDTSRGILGIIAR